MRRTALAVAAALLAAPAASAQPADKPPVKLVVLVVFDQLRGDYLDRWKPLFGKDGFNRLQDDGAWFTHCHYPYATTTTGPGHASLLTGTCPDRHGVINNEWYERGKAVYCAGDERYRLVPDPMEKPKPGARPKQVGTPERLLVDTVADALKRDRAGAKVFGLSLKDRSAILPTGKRPDGAFWFDNRFVTSTYYPDAAIPKWLEEYGASGAVDRWFGKPWDRLRPDLDYAKYSGPDDQPGEGRRVSTTTTPDDNVPPFGRTFPHPLGDEKAPGPRYREAVSFSPFGNDVVLEAAKRCVAAEGLGRDDVPDLLVVSFSSNDLIGHTWGPDSQEVLDVTLRSDRTMADWLAFLDDKVGKGNYAVVLSADHGVCPLPEVSAAKGLDAKRVDPKPFLAGIERHLDATFGEPAKAEGAKAAPNWLEAVYPPWLYVNPRVAKAAGKTPAEVAKETADYLSKRPEVFRVFTREELAGDFPEADVVGRRAKRSYHPARSGDVYVILRPYYLLSSPLSPGTTHGTPHGYDTHVPLLVYGPGVPGGRRDEPVAPQAAAAVVARFLGIRPPATAEYPVPATLDGK